MDTKTFLAMLARTGLKALAGFLIGHGYLQASGTEAFIGGGMALATAAWSFWNDYGRAILISELDMLKARAQQRQAAQGRVPGASSGLAVLAIGAALLTLGWASPAEAQAPRPFVPTVKTTAAPEVVKPAIPRPPICDPLNLIPGCHVDVQAPDGRGAPSTRPVELDIWKKITGAAIPDLEYASALASAAGTDAAGVRKQCWESLIRANKQAAGAGLTNPDGTPRAKPDPSLFTDVESLAEVLDNLAPNGPLWVACSGAAQLARTNVLTFINAAVTGATGMAALGVT